MDGSQWHLDKRVPIALMVALFMQTIGFLFAGYMTVQKLDYRVTLLESQSRETTHVNQSFREFKATQTANVLNMQRTLARIDKNVEALRNRK